MDNRRITSPAGAPADEVPFALVEEGPHGVLLSALNRGAREARLRPGQRLIDARTICPELVVEPADRAGDAAALNKLALWAQRWSPWTAVDGADGLLVDATACAHLFGGESAMLQDMARRFAGLGFTARIACAPTVGGSWAMARHSRCSVVSTNRESLAATLTPLPVRSLRLDPDAVLLLERLGLKTIDDLRAVPRLALARRFATESLGANPLHRLDQALGRIDEPVVPVLREPPVRVARRATDPIVHMSLLEHLLRGMAQDLCAALETRGLGLRRARFDGYRVDGSVQTVAAETARPMRDAGHLVRLFDGKLESLDAGFGFDAVVLTAARHEPLEEAQAHLLERESGDAVLARLVDRLSAKLGPDRVCRPVALQSHVPERSIGWRSALATPAKAIDTAQRPRPIRLFDHPEPITMPGIADDGAPILFVWRKLMHRIARCEGPERIAPEWWRERSTARLRDYYRVEDEAGRRYWLYREGCDGDGRGGEPGWFLHGLFA